MREFLFNTEKIQYVNGGKPDVPCILCAIRDGHPDVESLIVARTGTFLISVNLYPFNPGHIMIYPVRHIIDICELRTEEAAEMHGLLVKSLRILREEFHPAGFNVGYNLGSHSGASIAHMHQHIVPRYPNEVGYLDVLAGARVVVVDPCEVMERLRSRFAE